MLVLPSYKNQLISFANQLTDFYTRATLAFNGLILEAKFGDDPERWKALWVKMVFPIKIIRVELIYEKFVYWKKNVFLLPTGKSGKLYIDESVKLWNSWVEGTALYNTVFNAIMIMPNLLLQKLSKKAEAKDHLTALKRRVQSWLKGDLWSSCMRKRRYRRT